MATPGADGSTSNGNQSGNTKELGMEKRYIAAMVLSGVGDALGYKNGDWEFCHSGEQIHQELKKLGGLKKINVNKKGITLKSMHYTSCLFY